MALAGVQPFSYLELLFYYYAIKNQKKSIIRKEKLYMKTKCAPRPGRTTCLTSFFRHISILFELKTKQFYLLLYYILLSVIFFLLLFVYPLYFPPTSPWSYLLDPPLTLHITPYTLYFFHNITITSNHENFN